MFDADKAKRLIDEARNGGSGFSSDVADALAAACAEIERLTRERDREEDRAKYHSEMSERLGLDVARMRDERDEARVECERLRKLVGESRVDVQCETCSAPIGVPCSCADADEAAIRRDAGLGDDTPSDV